jgi:hypothetical protein
MFYLSPAFSLVWVCHLVYLLALDRQIRQMGRRMQARAETASASADG